MGSVTSALSRPRRTKVRVGAGGSPVSPRRPPPAAQPLATVLKLHREEETVPPEESPAPHRNAGARIVSDFELLQGFTSEKRPLANLRSRFSSSKYSSTPDSAGAAIIDGQNTLGVWTAYEKGCDGEMNSGSARPNTDLNTFEADALRETAEYRTPANLVYGSKSQNCLLNTIVSGLTSNLKEKPKPTIINDPRTPEEILADELPPVDSPEALVKTSFRSD
ncbi:hypothetical protein WISP_57888 [Willisornis vidua]|uniref:Uncharacterized protein n=1 Tax=Willisornis vidua TaxID=1566151 RepID=A0ABQ9DBG9_9PASS|nr:hypothetical protein WISP_57888 [Willisornis vidua]